MASMTVPATFAADVDNIFSQEVEIQRQSFKQLVKAFKEIRKMHDDGGAVIVSAEADLREELDLMCVFWNRNVQQQTDRFATRLSTGMNHIDLLRRKVAILAGRLEQNAKECVAKNNRLAEIARLMEKFATEQRQQKQVCLSADSHAKTGKKESRETQKIITREIRDQRAKESINDEAENDLEQLREDLGLLYEANESAVVDDTFGDYHQEVEVIFAEIGWDFDKLEELMSDRDKFRRRIALVQSDNTGRERARQHKIMSKKHAELKKESERLHAEHSRLKNLAISAERDLDIVLDSVPCNLASTLNS
ncbi:hypothetical protein BV898_17811 [Hypsibius exemplaris]|uniref:Uncharacterized protein n=1 Tax=Hypsibius exemplaris TaxID=2072580 RepID=A0A9X6NMW7_HYPEX|nr:hypothetical protein BV898_17811 [Hypsibius exemplaris]